MSNRPAMIWVLALLACLNAFADPAKQCVPVSGSLPVSSDSIETCVKVVKYLGPSVGTSSLDRKASYASLLLNPKSSSVIEDVLGPVCSGFLKNIYKAGKTLASDTLSKAARRLDASPFASRKPHRNFFHHTHTSGLQDQLATGDYDGVFRYLRERSDPLKLWKTVLFVAEDPDTSSGYGPKLVEFTFRPEAKVIDNDAPAWNEAYDELFDKFPGLDSACPKYGRFTLFKSFSAGIALLIAEDSGIDLIDYDAERMHVGSVGPHTWFQVLSFKNLESTAVLK